MKRTHMLRIKSAPHLSSAEFGMALTSRIFRRWRASIDSRFEVKEIHIRDVDFKGKASVESVLFVHMAVFHGEPLQKKIVVLRGHTVAMMPILMCRGVPYTILAVEPRLAIGKLKSRALSAGMVDNGTFVGAAAREIEEELDLCFREDELIDITPSHIPKDEGIALSAGLLDEQVRIYIAQRVVTRRELKALQGKATGLASEHEQITLKVVRLADLYKETNDCKAFVALALYESWQRNNIEK